MKLDLGALPPFNPVTNPSSVGQRWTSWRKQFETYLTAMNVTDDKQRKALLLFHVGQVTHEIFETLPDTGDDYATAMTKLQEYFVPKKNVDYEIFQFWQAKQEEGEMIDQFVTRLRKLAAYCEFSDLDRELKSAIIQNCTSKRLRRSALREENLTLDKLIAKARSLEASESQASGIEKSLQETTESLNRIHFNKKSSDNNKCRQCGQRWPHKSGPCPAKGLECRKCGKPNHFAKVCRTKGSSTARPTTKISFAPQKQRRLVRQIVEQTPEHQTSSSDDEYMFILGQSSDKSKIPFVSVTVNGVSTDMIVDTGASTNVLDEVAFQKVNESKTITLKTPTKRLFAYGSPSQLNSLGVFETTIRYKDTSYFTPVYVLQGNHGSLLSCKTAQSLGIVDIHLNHITHQTPRHEQLIQQFPSLFQGIGKLKDVNVQLHIDTAVEPVAQRARRIPFHLRKKVERELEKLEQQGIIEKVEGPTPWVSPLVAIPKKNGDVRLCVDMRMANKAIKRERHPSPTIDDLIHTLNGATIFSKLDLRAGYHQLQLAPESRYITTFATHKGLRRYARLNFGTNSASEIFQNAIFELIQDIPGALNISDDVIIFGKTQADHDKALQAVFQRFSDANVTLHKKKCELNKDSITFFGFVFSGDGISPDPKKVEAIKNVEPPTSKTGVRSFLGMANYCAKFIPSFSDISQPLRELTKDDSTFQWTEEHKRAFDKIKEILSSTPVMAYFDPAKETELVTDASPVGLSAILVQKCPKTKNRRVVAYVSRSLTDVESRYSQTEKEALAIVWSVERLHTYLYGSHFALYTDCKPVQLIFGNPKSKPPARIERWNLRLQGYEFDIIHTKGTSNPSDFLSRHGRSRASEKEEHNPMAEEYVNFLSSHAVPKAMTLEEIQEATSADTTLQYVARVIRENNWSPTGQAVPEDIRQAEVRKFAKVRGELTVNANADILLRGSRIVVPLSLRQRVITLAHEGHQDLVKTKKLLREKVWFPGIDDQVKEDISKCTACQANSSSSSPDPLQMSTLPPSAWHTVHIDFCGPFPSGEYLIVAIDAYSRFPEVEILHSTSATATIAKLDRIFATHGIPRVVKTDNGPPFTSYDFRAYMQEKGIDHKKITPLWPQANSEAENFMKPLTKAIRSANAEGKDWKKHLYQFLLNYRATPHCTTGFAPAELLFNRKIQTKLPQSVCTESSDSDHKKEMVDQNDKMAKQRMKEYADRKRKAKTSKFQIGDTVLIRQRKLNKLMTRFDPSPFILSNKDFGHVLWNKEVIRITSSSIL